ncbi:hypothetical protein FQR65_LT20046 [Abscondita terminalis]|nr:hypothetical protein FQR65_LT20046 [Abscondita terminalis]
MAAWHRLSNGGPRIGAIQFQPRIPRARSGAPSWCPAGSRTPAHSTSYPGPTCEEPGQRRVQSGQGHHRCARRADLAASNSCSTIIRNAAVAKKHGFEDDQLLAEESAEAMAGKAVLPRRCGCSTRTARRSATAALTGASGDGRMGATTDLGRIVLAPLHLRRSTAGGQAVARPTLVRLRPMSKELSMPRFSSRPGPRAGWNTAALAATTTSEAPPPRRPCPCWSPSAPAAASVAARSSFRCCAPGGRWTCQEQVATVEQDGPQQRQAQVELADQLAIAEQHAQAFGGDRGGHRGEHAQRGEAHHVVGDAEHDLGQLVDHVEDRVVALAANERQRRAEEQARTPGSAGSRYWPFASAMLLGNTCAMKS